MRWKVTTTPSRWIKRPPKKRNKMLSFRVTHEELRYLTLEANRQQVSLSELLRQAIKRFLGEP